MCGFVVPMACCGDAANVLADGAAASLADRCHSLPSLLPPPAAVGSLPKLEPLVRVIGTKKDDPEGSSFFGAGGRTRTGTLSPAVDFESTTSTIPSHRQVCFVFY